MEVGGYTSIKPDALRYMIINRERCKIVLNVLDKVAKLINIYKIWKV